MDPQLDPKDRAFYIRAMEIAEEAGLPFLVAGAYANERYTGIARHTKDFDLFIKPGDLGLALRTFAERGYHVEQPFPHWLAKVYHDDAFVDLIYRSGNAVCEVDDEWFAHAEDAVVLGHPARLCPAEEIIWSKAYIMERERFDGADVVHLILNRGDRLDWHRLLRRFGSHWRVLMAHVVLFGFIYPDRREQIPAWVIEHLADRLRGEAGPSAAEPHVCQGTLLSRAQYLTDLQRRDYEDARLEPRGGMTADDIDTWTAGIALDGSR